ncbi:MAG: MFS transporter [Bacteroidetes bacterium]|nr:MFS transporter [Bacteroidota bacterium]
MKLQRSNTDAFVAMRIPEFRHLMFGRFLFIMALRMLGALTGYWMYELTNNPLAIGLVGLAEVVPSVGLSLRAGYKIDISEKRKLLMTAVSLYITAVISLCFLSSSYALENIPKKIVVSTIYIVIFFTGIFRAYTGPTFGTLVANIVPKDSLQNGISWNQSTWLTASVIGHAVVGFLIAGIGIHGALIVIVTLVFTGLYCFYLLKQHPPIIKNIHLSAWPIGFGWLNAATDLGAIICILTIMRYPLKNQQGKKLLFAIAGFGLCMIVFAVSKVFWLSFVALLFSGILDGVSVVVRGTIVQLKTPNEMRGRVMSVSSMFINSSNELGQFESGVAARYMGNVASVIFGGCVTVAVAAFTWFKVPSIKKMKY